MSFILSRFRSNNQAVSSFRFAFQLPLCDPNIYSTPNQHTTPRWQTLSTSETKCQAKLAPPHSNSTRPSQPGLSNRPNRAFSPANQTNDAVVFEGTSEDVANPIAAPPGGHASPHPWEHGNREDGGDEGPPSALFLTYSDAVRR